MPIINFERNPNYEERITDGSTQAPCMMCGKGVNTHKPYMALQFLSDDEVISPEEEITEQHWNEGYLGALPIGRDCLRQHPELKGYAFEMEGLK